MKKQLKKLILGTLSASLFLAVSPIATYATDEADSTEETEEVSTEETTEEEATEEETTSEDSEESTADSESTEDSADEDLAPSADNPYTEAEITELILPTDQWDPNFVLERADLETGYETVIETAKERALSGEANLTFDEVVEIMGDDPTYVSETDNGEIFRYVSIEDNIVQVISFQTYLNSEERGTELVNVELEYKTAKMFERLETSVDELQELFNAGELGAFTEKFGNPQIVTTSLFPDRYTETLMWSVVGNEEVEVGEVAAVELQLENDEITNLAYYEQEEVESEESGDDSAEDSDAETTEEDSEESAE